MNVRVNNNTDITIKHFDIITGFLQAKNILIIITHYLVYLHLDNNLMHHADALPSSAARVTRGLARHGDASDTNPSLLDLTAEVLLRRHQHVTRKGKVKYLETKK